MVTISNHPELVEHYMKLAHELEETAEKIRKCPSTDRDLAMKLRHMAEEIRQSIGLLPETLKPGAATS